MAGNKRASFDDLTQEESDRIWRAVESSDLQVVELMNDIGVDINCHLAFYKWTALHLAAEKGHSQLTEVLLSSGADIETRSLYLKTPLHVAAEEGRVEVTKLLLAKGGDVTSRDKDNNTPLHLAVQKNKTDVAQLLVSKMDTSLLDQELKDKIQQLVV